MERGGKLGDLPHPEPDVVAVPQEAAADPTDEVRERVGVHVDEIDGVGVVAQEADELAVPVLGPGVREIEDSVVDAGRGQRPHGGPERFPDPLLRHGVACDVHAEGAVETSRPPGGDAARPRSERVRDAVRRAAVLPGPGEEAVAVRAERVGVGLLELGMLGVDVVPEAGDARAQAPPPRSASPRSCRAVRVSNGFPKRRFPSPRRE